jgi:hypothetical protein
MPAGSEEHNGRCTHQPIQKIEPKAIDVLADKMPMVKK